jgi:hypothetical protein
VNVCIPVLYFIIAHLYQRALSYSITVFIILFVLPYCISYLCNCIIYVTQVKRQVLRILNTYAVYAFIFHRRLAKEEVILLFFLICFGYSAPSVLSLKQRVNAE